MKQPQLDYYDMGADIVAFSSTRHGGCSRDNYAEFNINRYCGDNEKDICMNRQMLCQMLSISDDRLIMPHQVHLTKVVKIDEAFFSLNVDERQVRTRTKPYAPYLRGKNALRTLHSGR